MKRRGSTVESWRSGNRRPRGREPRSGRPERGSAPVGAILENSRGFLLFNVKHGPADPFLSDRIGGGGRGDGSRSADVVKRRASFGLQSAREVVVGVGAGGDIAHRLGIRRDALDRGDASLALDVAGQV